MSTWLSVYNFTTDFATPLACEKDKDGQSGFGSNPRHAPQVVHGLLQRHMLPQMRLKRLLKCCAFLF